MRARRARRAAALAVGAVLLSSACADRSGGDIEFTAVDVASGDAVTVDDVTGSRVLLAAWATWCVPCERELPALEAALDEIEAAGVRVIAVNVDGPDADADHVVDTLDRLAPSLESWRDADGTVLGAFGGVLMPFSVLLDEGGEPLRTWNGGLDPDTDDFRRTLNV